MNIYIGEQNNLNKYRKKTVPMKKVSIIVPIYNMGDKLKRVAVDILKQTYDHTEIILVDDGSTDNTLLVCKELAGQDPRIKIIHTENQGGGAARNTGLDHASGDYIYFADADDSLTAEAIATAVAAMERDNSDLAIFGYQAADSRGRIFSTVNYAKSTVDAELIRRSYTKKDESNIYSYQRPIWNKLFDLNTIRENNICFLNVRRHDPEVFVNQYLNIARQVSFIDGCFYTYQKDDYQTNLGKLPLNYYNDFVNILRLQRDLFTAWNPDNHNAAAFLHREYVQRLLRTLDLSFHKKMGFNRRQHLEWLKKTITRSEVQEAITAKTPFGSRFQQMVMAQIRNQKVYNLYFLLWLKSKKNLIRPKS